MSQITAEESFLLQAHAFAECCVKLGELEKDADPVFDKIYGQTAKIMANKKLSVFQGQGMLISVFYMFLVLPFEWKKKNIGNFGDLDLSEAEKIANDQVIVMTDTYPKNDDALRHFRNALAHGRLGWENGNLVVEDCDESRVYRYVAQYSMQGLGLLAQGLNMAIAYYVENVIKGRP